MRGLILSLYQKFIHRRFRYKVPNQAYQTGRLFHQYLPA
jgi:hypothetical protein